MINGKLEEHIKYLEIKCFTPLEMSQLIILSILYLALVVNMVRFALRIDDNGLASVKEMLGINKENTEERDNDSLQTEPEHVITAYNQTHYQFQPNFFASNAPEISNERRDGQNLLITIDILYYVNVKLD